MDKDRSPARRRPKVAALVLAAGQSQRMGATNKLLVDIDSVAMVAKVVDSLLASRVEPIVVVTGHQADQVREILADREVQFVHNDAYTEGLSTSLRVGLSALVTQLDAVVVCLGDMPWVSSAHIEALMDAFDPVQGHGICVPTYRGRRGNPVLWAFRYVSQMSALKGDIGARSLLDEHAEKVCFVPMDDDGVLRDVDTTDAL